MQKEAILYDTKYITMKKDDFHNEYSQCAYPCKVHRLLLNILFLEILLEHDEKRDYMNQF